MAKGVWGIDVSKYSVKAARIEKNREALELTGVDVVQYAGAGTGESGSLDEQIREALADLKTNNKIGGDRVVISLPGHSTFNRLVKLPPVDDEKIPEIVRYEAQNQIPFNIDEVIWDHQLIQREYGPGEEKEVILFAIKRDIVEQFLDSIKDVGLNIDAIQFGPVALYNFLMFDQKVDTAAVALDIGSDNTDLIIVDGSKFWVRNLPITGNDITRALQKAFNIPFPEAEKLKIKAGQSPQAQKIFNAIQPVLRDLVGEIHRSIGYYKSISKQIKFDRIMLLGNATRTLNFQKFLSQSLQLPAARIQKLNQIGVGQIDMGLLNNALPSLGTALGLALQGVTETANTVNLLPPAFLRKRELKKKQPFFIGTAACLGLLSVTMYLNADGQRVDYEKTATNINDTRTELQNLSSAFAQVNKDSQQMKDLVARLEPLTTIPPERDLVIKVMNEITPNFPENPAQPSVYNQEDTAAKSKANQQDEKRIWLLSWEFEEAETAEARKKREQEEAANKKTHSEKPPYPPLPKERELNVTLEVAIVKSGTTVQQKQEFLRKSLLNWDQQKNKPVDEKRPCAIKTFDLQSRETEPQIQIFPDLIASPLPEKAKPALTEWGVGGEEDVPRFTRAKITFKVPMKRNRAAEATDGKEQK